MIIQQSVISKNRGHEGAWIAFLCALILIFGALLLPYNSVNHEHNNLQAHQVLITELTPSPLSVIAELRLAHEEIRYFYQANQTWLSVAQLEQDWIAPFVKDKSWAYQGEHTWLLVAPGIYQSKPAKSGPSYLLNSQHQTLELWIDFKGINSQATSVKAVDSEALIKAGWKQVVFESEQDASQHAH